MSDFDPNDPALLDAIQGASIPVDSPAPGPAQAEQTPEPTPEPQPVAEEAPAQVEEVAQETEADSGGNPPNASEETPKTVPYDRLQQVVGERNTLRQEIAELQESRKVLHNLMNRDPETWRAAVNAGIIPDEIVGQYQQPPAPQEQQATEQDPWAEQPGLTQQQIDAMIAAKLRQETGPLVDVVRQMQHERSQQHLHQTYGDAYDPQRDNPRIAEIRLRLPGASLDEAFMLARKDVFSRPSAPADPTPPPEPNRGVVQRPASEGRTTRTRSAADEVKARLARLEDARGDSEVQALADLLQNP